MRVAAVFIFVLALVGCDEREPKLSDAQVQKLRTEEPGMTDACVEKARWEGIDALPDDWEECIKWTPPQRWRGLWRDEFEGSRFCPAPATECGLDTPGDVIWLDVQRVMKRGREPSGALYAVQLVGRRTAAKGHYGHMGGFDHELMVDRFVSIKKVGPPLTAQQQKAALQNCMSGKRRCGPD
jgi:hypothetical protein